MRKLLVILALCAAPAAAQPPGIWWNGGGSGSGSADPAQFSSPAGTLTVGGSVGAVTLDCDGSVCMFYSVGTSDPATCTQGGMFHYRTDSSLLKFCSATNTWGQIVTAANTSTSGFGFVVDEDNMASDSATKVPTQQSVKAYVDTAVAGAGTAFDPGSTVQLYEEFAGGEAVTLRTGQNGLTFTAVSSGTLSINSADFTYGAIRMTSAAGDNSGSVVGFGNPILSNGDWRADVLVKPGTNSTAITNTAMYVGFWAAGGTPDSAARAVWAYFDTDKSDATWKFAICDAAGASGCASATTSTDVDVMASTVAQAAGTAARIRIRRAASGVGGNPTIYFRVDSETEKTACSSGCDMGISNLSTSAMVFQVGYLTRTASSGLSGSADYMYGYFPGITR